MNRFYFAFLLIITTALMGSSFVVGKIGLAHISPILLAGLRFLAAGVLMAIFVRKYSHPHLLMDWIKIILIGLFQTVGVMGCIFVSLKTITAGESSILTFMNPLFVVILSTIFIGIRYTMIQWLGVILGCSGMIILGFAQWNNGTIIGLIGGLCWAIATLLIKKFNLTCSVWVVTAYQMLFGGFLLTLASLFMEDLRFTFNYISISSLAYLALFGSIAQFALWFYLLSKGDSTKTSAFLFLAPFFGVLFGYLCLDEPLHKEMAVGAVLVCTGIFLVNRSSSKNVNINKLTSE
ncbi:Threonine/homoserine efflux transporter RhtA [Paenibacillus sp. 1_12]|uniref:DMT family transporter n=1 Tax=Paenibacillus sp. 1_12 TaxID=1566278 RepID=UPI0008F3D4B9|nr:EamA family transporter [Paenibacillus sp. 1_12]SFL57554.1 Threonine/homoserine efflux transporter RhtA [Paenibacillus sp. 1_12]